MIRFAVAVALVSAVMSAASTSAWDPDVHADVWFVSDPGVSGHYTLDFSQPYPIPENWRKVELAAGRTMVITLRSECAVVRDIGGDDRWGLEEAIHALRVVAGG